MSLIDEIKRDREAGTKGLWRVLDENVNVGPDEALMNGISHLAVADVAAVLDGENARIANANRIARVPEMEAALLAAEELARVAGIAISQVDEWAVTDMTYPRLSRALAAYRIAVGAET